MSDSLNVDSKPPGWWQYIIAANATSGGSVVMLIIGLAVGFVWGYYTKYKSYSTKGAEIVLQADNNSELDKIAHQKMKENSDELNRILIQLGYTTSQIKKLLDNKQGPVDKLKDKVNNGNVHQSREDCFDDYVGAEETIKVNRIILNRFENGVDDE